MKHVVLNLTDFGAKPNSGEDTLVAMRRAIEAASRMECPVVLNCPKGRYDFYPEHAAKVPYYISNTASEEEGADVTKTVGILLKGMNNITLEGNGSLFMYHGKMITFVLDACENIEIRNLNTDFERATMSEMTVEAIGDLTLDVKVLPDSWYEIKDGELFWVGEGWSYQDGPAQEYDPETNVTWRISHPIMEAAKVEELEPYRLRLHYEKRPETKVGNVYQLRDGIRDQVGAFVLKCRHIAWRNVAMHYLHGLGIVNQFNDGLNFEKMNISPRPETGRTCAAFADCLHISGCRGMVRVIDSHFEGMHDDPINVHGTHLRIIDQPAPDQVLVRFMHPQSYGFEAFFPGDQIDFVSSRSLTVYESNTVASAEMIHPREVLITLKESIQSAIEPEDVIENATWTPEVEIRNNYFARVPTRGILVSTRRKVEIEDNTFERMVMSGILIADDASSWFESGMVNDVTIRGNRFIECGSIHDPVIYIAPENTDIRADNPVHRNILIEGNAIQAVNAQVLYAKSTQGLIFRNNRISASHSEHPPKDLCHAIHLTACSEVTISDNSFIGDGINKSIYIEKMPSENIVVSPGHGIRVIAGRE